MAIEVIIRDDGASISGISPTTTPTSPRGAKEEAGKPKPSQTNINALLIDYGRNIINQGVNVALDYSGNNILKDQINTVTNIATDILMIAQGGWVGVAAVAFKAASGAVNSFIQLDRNRYTSEVLRQQAGKIVELGGRYTND
jgi:hypothetical protein